MNLIDSSSNSPVCINKKRINYWNSIVSSNKLYKSPLSCHSQYPNLHHTHRGKEDCLDPLESTPKNIYVCFRDEKDLKRMILKKKTLLWLEKCLINFENKKHFSEICWRENKFIRNQLRYKNKNLVERYYFIFKKINKFLRNLVGSKRTNSLETN